MNDKHTVEAPKIILIVGPTGAGKTTFAINLARRFNGEIVGADSMQIYRCMDIGTAKPTPAERAASPHHMIDIVDPDEDFDAAAYAKMASDIIRQTIDAGAHCFCRGGNRVLHQGADSRPFRERAIGPGGSPASEAAVWNRKGLRRLTGA